MNKFLSAIILLLAAYASSAKSISVKAFFSAASVVLNDTARQSKDSLDLKSARYFKGRVLAKFKPGYLTLLALTDTVTQRDLTKLVEKKYHSDRFEEVKKHIDGMRPLTKLTKGLARKLLSDTTGAVYRDIYDIVIISCKEGKEEQTIKGLLKTGMFEYAEPDYMMQSTSVPNDPNYWLQNAWDNIDDRDIDVETAWETNTGSPNVKVAILDSGIDYTNVDLGNGSWNHSSAKVVGGYNYYSNNANPMDDHVYSHGTAVAGIIGAYRNNGNLVAGIAGGDVASGNPGVKLYALKVGDHYADISTSAFSAALIASAKPVSEGGLGCHIANFSAGIGIHSNTVVQALRYAAKEDVLFVAAKGNTNTNALHYPSDYKDNWVLSVGASTPGDLRVRPISTGGSWGSNWGNNMDVVAPGIDHEIYTTARGVNGSNFFGGTSASAPIVSGIAALLKSQRPDLHRDDLEQLIKISAEKVRQDVYSYVNGYHDEMGFGRVNAGNAMAYLKAPYKLVHRTARFPNGFTSNQPSTELLQFSGNSLSGSYYGKRYEMRVTIPKLFCGGENYIWPRIEGQSWYTESTLGASPNNDLDSYVKIENVTANSADLVTYVYYIEKTSSGKPVNRYYPCDISSVRIAYTSLGLEEFYMPDKIQGPSLVCNSETFSIPGVPAGTVVNWTAVPPEAVTLSSSGNQVVVGKVLDALVGLTGTYQTTCGTKEASTYINVGHPNLSPPSGLESPPINTSFRYWLGVNGLISCEWYVSGGAATVVQSGDAYVDINFHESVGYTIQAKVVTQCGEIWSPEAYISPYGGYEDDYSYSLSPNPSNDELTIEYQAKEKEGLRTVPGKNFNVALIDSKGQIHRAGKSNGNRIVLNTQDMVAGTYYLHINDGKKLIKRQVIIKH
jgi:subtilisin family serine protease